MKRPILKFRILLFNVCLLLFISCYIGCKKLVVIPPPPNAISDMSVYSNDGTAISVLTGVYILMSNAGTSQVFTGNQCISMLSGLSADELTLYGGVSSAKLIAYYKNALSVNNNTGSELWGPLYNYVFKCNAAIEGLNSSTTISPSVKRQLLGEAKFMRAFFYFYLVNLFGDVPLAVTSDYKENSLLSRAPATQVYQQIITDLKDAQGLLSLNYLDGTLQNTTSEKVRPTKWAACALLARTYLYTGDWENAEAQSDSVLNHSTLYGLDSLNKNFLKNSLEAIWQLQPVITGHNTEDAWAFIIPTTGPTDLGGGHPVYLSPQVLNAFEPGDKRNAIWVGNVTTSSGATYYYPYKYKSATLGAGLTEYLMVLRLGEQYLIRAEARAQQDNILGAQSDLNILRTRAGLPNTSAGDKTSLLTAILHERQVELFTEWGHRWLDLKRTGSIDGVMTSVTSAKANGNIWQSYQKLYPLPLNDVKTGINLVQNPNY